MSHVHCNFLTEFYGHIIWPISVIKFLMHLLQSTDLAFICVLNKIHKINAEWGGCGRTIYQSIHPSICSSTCFISNITRQILLMVTVTGGGRVYLYKKLRANLILTPYYICLSEKKTTDAVAYDETFLLSLRLDLLHWTPTLYPLGIGSEVVEAWN